MFCLEDLNNFKKMIKFEDNNDADSDSEDPQQLLNVWLGELNDLTEGLDSINPTTQLRPLTSDITAPRIDSYRFSMANLEDSQDVDLDAILGELCALENECEREIGHARDSKRLSDTQKVSQHMSRTHSRSSSEGPRLKLDPGESDLILKTEGRTESPDNDSAFSDTVSMLSSESSASSGGSGANNKHPSQNLHLTNNNSNNNNNNNNNNTNTNSNNNSQDEASRIKAEKIRMAMEKIKEANIQKLFVKVFTNDGSAKSLLVDEKMLCSYVTRLLADKNHVQMDPKWAIVEHLPDLYMERFYEDHELLVDNLMLWTRDSKNKIYFAERQDKIKLFVQPEKYLLSPSDKRSNDISDYDEHSRSMLLEEFFSSTSSTIIVPELEGHLYLKAESKKGWKKYQFVLRASGLYYYPKEKIKSAKDLICLATFDNNQIYYGLGWKKKFKSPTDWCFAIKHPRLQEPKSTKFIKYLCAEDYQTLEKWMVGMRIAKYGKQLMDNYRNLMDELAQEDLDILAHARSCSVSSIAVQSNVTTPTQGYPSSEAGYGTQSETSFSATPSEISSSGRHSRASSSSSSGCMSDGAPSSCENAFDSEFPMGTIKRKPSMKPSLPLTNITRQLKEVGETRDEIDGTMVMSATTPNFSNTNNNNNNSGTLTRRHSRRKSNEDGNGTLKRQHSYKARGSIESMGARSGNSTPLCSTPVRERISPFEDNLERTNSFCGGERPNVVSITSPTNIEMPSCMTDSITSLPPPPPPPPETNGEIISDLSSYQLPPPPPEVYNSNLSLDSLPPPPNPNDLPPISGEELTGSQLSLMSLPPPPGDVDSGTLRRGKCGTPTNIMSPEKTPTQEMSPDQTPTHSRLNTPCYTPPLSNCSTPTQNNPPVSFSPTHYAQNYGQNHDRNNCNGFININYNINNNNNNNKQSNTLPTTYNINNNNGLRSSLRQSSLPRQISSNSISSNSSGSSTSTYTGSVGDMRNSPNLSKKINYHEQQQQQKHSSSPKKVTKKISFNLTPQELPPILPKKPQPPKRSDTTKLTSPKKLIEPPNDFLKDLQRVMRKKWQVAQKCKLDQTTTPHEVLGFRDPPILLPDYKEHNVSNWVKEHYGANNLYENIYRDNNGGGVDVGDGNVICNDVVEYISSPLHQMRGKRPPPPPPPKRSETTHLTTTPKH